MNVNAARVSNKRSLNVQVRMWLRVVLFACLLFGFFFYRVLSDTPANRMLLEDPFIDKECPLPIDPAYLVILYILGSLWLFVGLAIVTEDFYVPSLDLISKWWKLSPGIAGATLMTMGGSTPAVCTSIVGTFIGSTIGLEAIVGAAIFNLLLAIGICSLVAPTALTVNRVSFIRDSVCYLLALVVLTLVFAVITPNMISWYQALGLLLFYWFYVFVVYKNDTILKLFRSTAQSDKEVTVETTTKSTMHEKQGRRQSVSRARLGSFLVTKRPSLNVSSGIGEVTDMMERVQAAFTEHDKASTGYVTTKDIPSVLLSLGIAPSTIVISSVPMTAERIEYKDFCIWFLQSRARLVSEVKAAFDQVDTDQTGTIPVADIRSVLKFLGTPKVTEDELEKILAAIREKNTEADLTLSIPYAYFESWYISSEYMHRKQDEADSTASAAKGMSIYPPQGADRSIGTMAWYLITLPFILAFTTTIPDVHKPRFQNWAYSSMFMSLAWIGLISYINVNLIESIGATLHIPSICMALTFLGAGASFSDLLSAIVLSKRGEGEQALTFLFSGAIFELTVGLGFPWLLYDVVYQHPVFIKSTQFLGCIASLAACAVVVLCTPIISKWTVAKPFGIFLIVLYVVYVGVQMGIADWDHPCYVVG